MPSLLKLPGPCFYCGSAGPIQTDHVIPRSRGGTNTLSNFVPACPLCNQDKSDMTPEEWRADRIANGLSWPPIWNHADCVAAWDEHHRCVTEGRIARRKITECVICGRKVYQVEWCRRHYRSWYKYGDPEDIDRRRAQNRARSILKKQADAVMSEWNRELKAMIGPRLYFCTVVLLDGSVCDAEFRSGKGGSVENGMCNIHAKRFGRTGHPLGAELLGNPGSSGYLSTPEGRAANSAKGQVPVGRRWKSEIQEDLESSTYWPR